MPLGYLGATGLGATVQLIIVSALFGVLMVLLFGAVSNQGAIRRVKTRISAALLEVVLFRYDTWISLKAQGELLFSGAKYFVLALGPVLILAIPFTLILGHLNLRLGARPLQVGEESVLSVNVPNGSDLRKVTLVAPPAIGVVGPVRIERTGSLVWRLKANTAGAHTVTVNVNEQPVLQERVNVGDRRGEPQGIYLSRKEWLTSMLFPNGGLATRLANDQVDGISLDYPAVSYSLFGLQMSWMTLFLIVSMAVGYACSRVLGVAV